jgi:flavin-dependent dehydrogenase
MASPGTPARKHEWDVASIPLVDHGACAESSLVITSRAALDRALLDVALARGARLIAERVVDVGDTADGVTVRTHAGTHRAGILLGADGANSLVRRRLVAAFTHAQLSVGTGYFVWGASSRDLVIRWVSNPPGYLWSFPRSDHLAVGICAQRDTFTLVGDLQRAAAAWIGAANLAECSTEWERYSWPIPSLRTRDFEDLRVAGERWMLLGDAAGLVDPLTREGIFYALRSGEMAAQAITQAPTAAGRWYRTQLCDTVVPELRRAALLKGAFFNAHFSRLVVRALADSPAIRAVMVDLIGGRQPYIGLRRRLLATWKLRLAMQAFGLGWAKPGEG